MDQGGGQLGPHPGPPAALEARSCPKKAKGGPAALFLPQGLPHQGQAWSLNAAQTFWTDGQLHAQELGTQASGLMPCFWFVVSPSAQDVGRWEEERDGAQG